MKNFIFCAVFDKKLQKVLKITKSIKENVPVRLVFKDIFTHIFFKFCKI